MKKASFAVILSLFSVAFAQTPRETYQARANQDPDHKWADSINSERFTIWYSKNAADCASLTTAQAQQALSELEKIYDVYIDQSNFQPPYVTNAIKYKMGVYVLRNGSNCANAPASSCGGKPCCDNSAACSEGYAFGGAIGNPRAPGMWLSSSAVSDNWVLAHEFMHGLQAMTGGMSGGSTNQATNFTGWFHESHANLMPHQVYPTEVHYCAEMYTRTAELYLGSTRNRYCNWQFFEYVMDIKGIGTVNDIWTKSSGQSGTDPMAEIMRQNSMSQKDFNDLFGEFATKAVIWDMKRGSALFRNAYNGVNDRYKRQRYAQLEALDSTDGANGRFASPFMFSPQRYGFNIIRLYPNANNSSVTVKFRGDVQTQNNIPNYARGQNLEPQVANLPNDPQSDWRYGLVAVTGEAASKTGTVTARYSPVMRASDGNPDVSITMQNSETQLYLVVAATPKIHHKISWDQYFYTIYRFPYMVEINGAKPDGFQAIANPAGGQHANGGGFVQSTATVASTAYVGPNARVTGNAKVSGNARIEDRAVASGGIVQDNAIVKDYAKVFGGTISGSAIISEHANILGGTFSGNAKVYGFPVITTGTVTGDAHVGGVGLIEAAINLSGTAQLQGDIEVGAFTANVGVYFGIVGEDGTIGKNRTVADHGGPVPKREVTKPRSMIWYGDSSGSGGATNIAVAVQSAKFFNLNNSGIFSYNLGGVTFAKLKIYNSRGNLLKTISLNGTHGIVDIQINTTQVLLWRVERPNGKLIGQTRINALTR
jgi:hypothetical protein